MLWAPLRFSVCSFLSLFFLSSSPTNILKRLILDESDSSAKNASDVDVSDTSRLSSVSTEPTPSTSHDMTALPTTSTASQRSKGNDKILVPIAHEFMVGEKSNSLLLSTIPDHHLYSKNGTCVHGIRYRCRDRKCRAFVIFDPKKNECYRLSSSPAHKHRKSSSDFSFWVDRVQHGNGEPNMLYVFFIV